MQKNDKDVAENNDMNWESVEKYLASEVVSGAKRESKAKNLGLICMTGLSLLVIGGLLFVNYTQNKSIERNNQDWLDYLSQYDFVSQDGEGINNINTGEQGDLLNGATSQIEERQEQR